MAAKEKSHLSLVRFEFPAYTPFKVRRLLVLRRVLRDTKDQGKELEPKKLWKLIDTYNKLFNELNSDEFLTYMNLAYPVPITKPAISLVYSQRK